ncbi:MAG: DUF4399 domain-containing protein [Mariprofundaceae bacterium]
MKQLLTILSIVGAVFVMGSVAEACNKGEKSCSHNDVKACALAHQAGPYFISPKDGETLSGKITIKMGVNGMKVHKAGDVIDGTGHHHLIIDGHFVPEMQAVAKDATHIHFGKGQTETEIELSKGKHTLTLQFADGMHQSYGKVFSRTIQVMVE